MRAGLGAGRQAARLLAEELPAALALARVIRRERADVVHLGNGLRANFDGILAGLLTRRPIVCHVKGFEKYSARERWAARRTTTLVCMTQAVLDHCRAHGMRAPDERVVYDAVDEAWLRPARPAEAVRRDLGIPLDAPCIGIAGNIQEWKGQHVVVEALGQLSDHGRRALRDRRRRAPRRRGLRRRAARRASPRSVWPTASTWSAFGPTFRT